MSEQAHPTGGTVNTVLGPVPAAELGIIATHEALLSVLPGAQYAPDITIDRAENFEIIAEKLRAFREHGGGTLVDATGMFHGRDLRLYEVLSKATGVHIIASTGLGPEENLGGYFLTPQTNPPTPWPAEKFEQLFSAEITDGMVVPRVERRAPAGLVAVEISAEGITGTEEGLLRGAARSAQRTGTALSLRYGSDAVAELELALGEGIEAHRIVVGGMDRQDAVESGAVFEIAQRGAMVALDHVGANDAQGYLDDGQRVELIKELVAAGHGERIIISLNSIGVAKGIAPREIPYAHLLTEFIPFASARGLDERTLRKILADNPRMLLSGSSRH